MSVVVEPNASALVLPPGSYADTVTFTNATNGVSLTRDASLVVAEPLSLMPSSGLTSSGDQGGPFVPTGTSYTLTNDATEDMDWTAARTVPWLDVTPPSGTLTGSGATDTINADLNAIADSLAPGVHTDVVTVTHVLRRIGPAQPLMHGQSPQVPRLCASKQTPFARRVRASCASSALADEAQTTRCHVRPWPHYAHRRHLCAAEKQAPLHSINKTDTGLTSAYCGIAFGPILGPPGAYSKERRTRRGTNGVRSMVPELAAMSWKAERPMVCFAGVGAFLSSGGTMLDASDRSHWSCTG